MTLEERMASMERAQVGLAAAMQQLHELVTAIVVPEATAELIEPGPPSPEDSHRAHQARRARRTA